MVELEDRKSHPLYGKIIRTTSKVKAHDENGDAGVGDRVRIMETCPLSATKHWRPSRCWRRLKCRPSKFAKAARPRLGVGRFAVLPGGSMSARWKAGTR